jgi:hypothetical protein
MLSRLQLIVQGISLLVLTYQKLLPRYCCLMLNEQLYNEAASGDAS